MKKKNYLLTLLCGLLSLNAWSQQPLADTLETPRNLGHYVFNTAEGDQRAISELSGKYVFIELWSLFCVPCHREMVYFKQLEEQFRDEPIEFVAICIENNEPAWKNFVKNKGLKGHQWVVPIKGPFLHENRFLSVPRFIMLDQAGNILWNRAKRPSDPTLAADLDLLLR